ncbi:hypothetical protein ACQ856_29170 (plasmid) [Mycolicibacterium psychrotolerans]|uniref:hypothetical protein n=1 Tax=Mycolicibacterium psychrotolerans TaxID=216929 RepID=UPI003D670F9A
MWIRWVALPWWARWLVTSVVLLAFYGGITAAQVAEHPGRPPAWVAPTVIGACLISAALGATNQRARMAPYAAIVADLTTDQQRELAAAIKSGPLPTDPAVLAAALRIKNLARAERQRRPLWLAWVFIAAVILYAEWLISMPSTTVVGAAMNVVAAVYAVLLLWGQVRRRRAHRRWVAVAAAVDADASATAMIAAAQDVPAKRDRRQWACLIGAAAVIGGSYGATNVAVRSAQIAECRLAAGVVNFIADRKDLLDPTHLGSDEPPLSDYDQWASRIDSYTAVAQGHSLSPDVTRIRDRAAAVVRDVEDARQSPQTPPSAAQTTAFRTAVTELIAAEQPLVVACRYQYPT